MAPANVCRGLGLLHRSGLWRRRQLAREEVMSQSKLLGYAIPIATVLVLRAVIPVGLYDDAYISFRVAQNLAAGHGMVFNPGEHVYVSTSPAWVLLLAGLRFVVGDVPLAARILGAVFEVLLVLALVRYGSKTWLGMPVGVFAAVLLVTNPAFLLTSFGGMELPLFLLVIVMVAYWAMEGKFAASAAAAAFAVWVRFDGFIVLAVTIAMALWGQRADLRKHPHRVLLSLGPAIAVVGGYLVFGMLLFDTWIPMSVQRKALGSPALFSPTWFRGSMIVAAEYARAFIGRSDGWYRQSTPLIVMVVPLALGAMLQFRRRDTTLLPLFILSGAYAAAFAGSGNPYARNFPWYFVPILPAAYLGAGVGLAWLVRCLSSLKSPLQSPRAEAMAQAVTAIAWVLLAFAPLRGDAVTLRTELTDDRVRVYAAAAVWAGAHLDKKAWVAANEIGTVGFFLPPDCSVLDMFGIARTKDTLAVPSGELVARRRPECVLTRQGFTYKRRIEEAAGNDYVWTKYRTLDIGMRRDLSGRMQSHLYELPGIYASLDINRAYMWSGIPRPAD
jgi:hypothetical protein